MPTRDQFYETRKNLNGFYASIELPGGYSWSHTDTLKRIDLYYNSQFETGSRDSRGFRKFFYNITKPACDIATKFIDLDTKDFILTSEKDGDEMKVWLMQRDLRHWMKKNNFGKTLNEISFDYPKYGTVVIKKDKGGVWKKVNLVNLRMDISARSLEDSSFVYEVHSMTRKEIEEMPWDKEMVDQLFVRNKDELYALVYECYEYNIDKGRKWKRSFKADFLSAKTREGVYQTSAESQFSDESEYLPGIILHEDEIDELPYRELHWERIAGRWLGFGFSEYLFDNQIRMNEVVNIKSKGLYFTSLKLFQTADETIGRNILTDVENGDILKVSSPISPVPMEERNLSVFSQEENRWDLNTERKTFSFDISRGEELPSGTPLGVARLSAGMVASYFQLKRENFGLFLKDLVLTDILPSFQKESRKEHLLRFLSSDREIEKVRKLIVDVNLRKALWDFVQKTGTVPAIEFIEQQRTEIEKKLLQNNRSLYMKIPENFYSDVDYSIDVVITGEQMDTGARIQTLQVALQIVGGNPQIVQNGATRAIFFKMLELAGVSGIDLNLLEEKAQLAQTEQQGQRALPRAAPIAGTAAQPSGANVLQTEIAA